MKSGSDPICGQDSHTEEQVSPQANSGLPLVTVVVPTYGRAGKVRRALESVSSQTYPSVEIVVVDDNDDPNLRELTRAAVLQTSARYPLKFIETTGRTGGGRARNLGVHAALGEYVAFLDDDDEYLEGKLDKQVAYMLEHSLDVCYQDVTWVNESGRLIEYRRLDHAKDGSPDELLRAHLRTPISPTAIYMIRKDYFERTAGFGDVNVGQDWILMLRCIEARGRIRYMPGAYVRQHLHQGDRLSTGLKKIRGENHIHSIRKTYFHAISLSDRRFVSFRHFAVLAFASLRSRFFVRATLYGIVAVLVSPGAAFREGKALFRGRNSRQQQ